MTIKNKKGTAAVTVSPSNGVFEVELERLYKIVDKTEQMRAFFSAEELLAIRAEIDAAIKEDGWYVYCDVCRAWIHTDEIHEDGPYTVHGEHLTDPPYVHRWGCATN